GVHLPVPPDDVARRAASPALVHQSIDLVHVEATHLRKPPLAAEHTRGVRLPVHDVGEGVLHRPRVPRLGTWDASLPVRRAKTRPEAVQVGKLAACPDDDAPTGVPHRTSIVPRDGGSRERPSPGGWARRIDDVATEASPR